MNDHPPLRSTDLKHTFDVIRFDDGTIVPEIRFANARARLIGRLLMNDLQGGDAAETLDLIESVHDGRRLMAEVAGNTTRLVIGPQICRLTDDLTDSADGGDFGHGVDPVHVDVATLSLRQIIVEWVGYAARARAQNSRGHEPRGEHGHESSAQ